MKNIKHHVETSEYKVGFQEIKTEMASTGNISREVFKRGTLRAVLYKPDKIDKQQAHNQDEAYIVVSGNGFFYCEGKTVKFKEGDFLFVPADAEHWFENFTEDFITWVLFYGPEGGEKE
jgi:mannose-6-phosphate isomerase-like protein (cupin superfamily)